MNRGKIFSGIAALLIYMFLLLTILFFYNIHQKKAKNYVEKNEHRVTVTLVNSDKTVLNRSDKSSNTNKPVPLVAPPIPLKSPTKKSFEKRVKVSPKKVKHNSKPIPKKVVRPKVKKHVVVKKIETKRVLSKHKTKKTIKRAVKKKLPKKKVPKKIVRKVPKKVVPKKVVPKKTVKRIVKKKLPKKKVPKKIVRKVPKNYIPKKIIPEKIVPKKVIPKKSARDLFSSVKTRDIQRRPIKSRPKYVPREQVQSSIYHRSSIADRVKNSHQSGHTSNANREKGVENAYIRDVKRRMNNWNANPEHIGKRVSIILTIYNSGKFSYRITRGSGSIRASLAQYLNQLQRIGLKRHSKSTPYSIEVNYTVR